MAVVRTAVPKPSNSLSSTHDTMKLHSLGILFTNLDNRSFHIVTGPHMQSHASMVREYRDKYMHTKPISHSGSACNANTCKQLVNGHLSNDHWPSYRTD